MGRFFRRLVPALAAVAAWGGLAQADSTSCLSNGPLLVAPLSGPIVVEAGGARNADLDGDGSTTSLGQWQLPVSPLEPDLLTEAVAELRYDSGLELVLSFPSAGELGIPFTFQYATLEWEEEGETRSTDIDWSEQCQEPGRALEPGDQWSARLELAGERSGAILENPVLVLWGSQN